MTPERWQRVKELLHAALERRPGQRAAFLAEHCAGDPELRLEVDTLLAASEEADDGFLEQDAAAHVGSAAPSPLRTAAFNNAAITQPVNVPFVETRIGNWRIIGEIGRGGMGTVYKAVRGDDPQRRVFALKTLRRGMDQEFILRRFRTERKILATLDHPNIARLLDAGATDDGIPYFVMEYVEGGRTLVDYCDGNRLDTNARLSLFIDLCAAVQCAHDRKIIHRDIKPGNVLVDSRGMPRLLDFGIAKILDPDLVTQSSAEPTATMLRMMTPEYASPEQVRGNEITPASDVYSLGVLLYETLTGHRPYRLRSKVAWEVAEIICQHEPERPSSVVGRTEIVTRGDTAVTVTPTIVSEARRTKPSDLKKSLSGEIDKIVLMAMRKEPERRYPSAGALAADLRSYLHGSPVQAKGDTAWYQLHRFAARHRTLSFAALALVLATAGLAVLAAKCYLHIPGSTAPSVTLTSMPLTSFPGDETQPAFSPDSTRVAFVWEGENSDNSDIYVKPVRGVGLERITTDSAEDVSPTWSPDGRRIAWLRVNADETAVFIGPAVPSAQPSKLATLYPNRIEAVGRHLDWSPDGQSLAAADKMSPDEPFRLVSIELASGQKTQITTPPPGTVGDSNPAFSPDGKSIAFIRGISSGVDDIFVKPLDGGPARRITNDKRYIISLAWTADGRYILFSSNRAGNHSLWRVAAQGGAPERFNAGGDNISDPVLSRDGKLLAYSQFYQDTNIWAMDLGTLARRSFIASTQYDSSPAWGYDGKSVVFRSSRGGSNEIWIADGQGNNPRQVTKFGGTLSGSPKLSPDGTRIAFDSRPYGQPDIFTIGADGGDLIRITDDVNEDVVPSWSSDGKWLYFGSNRGGAWQVWKAPASGGGGAVQLTRGGGFAAKESPDGKWVYYAKGRSVTGLWRIRPDGSNEESVLDRLKPGLWAYWAVTRQGIWFADREPGKASFGLYLLTNPRREVERITQFDRPVVMADQGMTASLDGRTLLYAQVDQSGSDLLMVDLAPLVQK